MTHNLEIDIRSDFKQVQYLRGAHDAVLSPQLVSNQWFVLKFLITGYLIASGRVPK